MDLYLPFDSIDNDRVHHAGDIADLFAFVMTTGVHPTPGSGLFVSAAGGWDLAIAPGRCVIQGRVGINRLDKVLTLDAPHGVLNRIDSVVLRCDYGKRLIEEIIRKGVPASSPVPVTLQRDADAFEICLAQVAVAADATQIYQGNITDTRRVSELCGVASSLIEVEPDTLFAQYEALWTDWFQKEKDDSMAWRNDLEGAVTQWFAGIQSMLEGEAAVALAQRISALEMKFPGTVYEIGRLDFSLAPGNWTAVSGKEGLWSAAVTSGLITGSTDAWVYLSVGYLGAPLYDLVEVAPGKVMLYATKRLEETLQGVIVLQGRRS